MKKILSLFIVISLIAITSLFKNGVISSNHNFTENDPPVIIPPIKVQIKKLYSFDVKQTVNQKIIYKQV